MKLLATIQALDEAQRRVDPMRLTLAALREAVALQVANQIGRASCRERVCAQV